MCWHTRTQHDHVGGLHHAACMRRDALNRSCLRKIWRARNATNTAICVVVVYTNFPNKRRYSDGYRLQHMHLTSYSNSLCTISTKWRRTTVYFGSASRGHRCTLVVVHFLHKINFKQLSICAWCLYDSDAKYIAMSCPSNKHMNDNETIPQ